jgi:uncharacterized membrane protein YhaH (DUF805 family)
MGRFKRIDFWLGLLILTVLGFLAFVLTAGLGYLIALVFILHSWGYIIFGTLLGMAAVFLQLLYLHDKKEKK